ncbi:F-box protein [Cardamine amara subsp. amara]|uniref:F-box protein n=1 Tax=Cardamine amara subsp. amara TaxID=228776 RepID=A0ABD1BMC7_CARAN
MATNSTDTPIEELPQDILGEIISRVARFSRTTVRNVMAVAPKLAKGAQNDKVYKNMNLKPLAVSPLQAVNKYHQLMERCLKSGNEESHYIKGIQEYFHQNNTTTGLDVLKASAQGTYENGIYLYGITMLCRGNFDEGKTYLDKLGWRKNKSKADQCWRNNKRALHGIRVLRKRRYFRSLRANKPVGCDKNKLDTQCNNCYYYKQMVKFVFII